MDENSEKETKNPRYNDVGQRLCEAERLDGEPCQAPAILEAAEDGHFYCWFHHPDIEEERKEARSQGGRRGPYTRVVELPDTAQDAAYLVTAAKAFLEDVQERPASKRDDNIYLRALGELRSALQFEYEYGSVMERLERLEQMIE